MNHAVVTAFSIVAMIVLGLGNELPNLIIWTMPSLS